MTRAEVLSGFPNPIDGALVMVMGRRAGKLRLSVARNGADEPTRLVGEGDVLELTDRWRIVRIEPRPEPNASAGLGSGSGRLVAVLERVG